MERLLCGVRLMVRCGTRYRDVICEAGAGMISGFHDQAYKNVGCTVTTRDEVLDKNQMIAFINTL